MSEKVFPASLGQQRLWLLDQIEPGTPAYNIARAFRLIGSLDTAALSKALQSIISRHDSLRTVFTSLDEEVGQIVLTSLEFDLAVSDVSELPAEQGELAALNIAGEEATKPFDLSEGPLLRARLLRLNSTEHILILVVHHIIVDGWSMNLLFHEMGELYAGFTTGRQPQLPNLNLQYSDYSRWQRATLTSDFLASELDYWKNKLQSAETVLQLPTDHPRTATHSGRGNSIHFELSSETNKSLKELAQTENATLFMALLTIFQILLGRYTSQASILVGSPTAGRNDVELENMIGFFVNTLVLRADLDADNSFRQLLRQARATTLEALEHQNAPFEKVVETLEPSRNSNRNPLFQVMFILQNAPRMKVELPGLVMQEIEFETGISKFDLTLEIIDLDNLYCTIEYNSDLYEENTIQRMAGHFTHLVEMIITAPDEKLSSFSILTAVEKQQLEEWNNTNGDYPRQLCVHTAFEDQVNRTPDKIAVIDQYNRLSYEQLNWLANRFARSLIREGVQPGDLVGVSLARSTGMVIALLGILKAGAAYVPLDPVYPEQRLDFIVEDAQIKVVVTSSEFSNVWRKRGIDVLALDAEDLSAEVGNTDNQSLSLSAESRMYVIYTSGSTGRPKGVQGSHRAAINRFSWMWNAYPFLDIETCCQKTSLGFVDSIWEIFGPLLRGIPLVIVPDEIVIDPEGLVHFLAKYEVTRIVLVPSLLRAILEGVDDIKKKLPRLTLWTCSGEALTYDLVSRFSQLLPEATLLNIYGSSEVAADVTWCEIRPANCSGAVPIGRPITNVQMFILDRHMNQVPAGVLGEIHVGGDCLAIGYLNRPELTFERFVLHHIEPGRSVRLFKTGDLGRFLPNGEIEYLGRTDNQVKLRGIRVELGEIEAVLRSHPIVRDAVVVFADQSGLQRLSSYLEAHSELNPDIDDLRRFMRSRLPEYMIPSDYLIVDALPLLPSGKIDRRTLVTLTSARSIGNRGRVAPQTPTEERLVAIWSSLLKTDQIGITDNFFELGGHSLMVMQVVARIRKELEVEIPMRALFEEPTIRGLAKEVDEATAKGIKAQAPISSFLREQSARDHLRLQVEQMSREELEEMLRRVLSERSGAS